MQKKNLHISWWLAPLLLLTLRVQAQPAQPVRVELELAPENTFANVLCLRDSSTVLFTQTYHRRHDSYTLRSYNAQLQLRWTQQVQLPHGSRLIQTHSGRHSAYYLFLTNRPNEICFLQLHAPSGTTHLLKQTLPTPVELGEFKVLGDYAFLVATALRHQTVLHLNIVSGESRFLPALYEEIGALEDFQVDEAKAEAVFIVAGAKGMKSRLQIKKFSADGRYTGTYFLQSPEPNSLIAGRLSLSDSAGSFIAGLYTLRDLRYAQGIFTAGPDTGAAPFSFYDFTTFSHFFDYMRPRRQARVRRRIERNREKQKIWRLRYRVLLHDLYTHGDGYVLVGEVYYPQYRSSNMPEWGFRGQNYRIFDGFRYTHAFVCGLDRNGRLLWDNSCSMKDMVLYDLQQVYRTGIDAEMVVLASAAENDILYKIVRKGQPSGNFQRVPVMTYEASERVLQTDQAGIRNLYGSTFIASGFQKVRSLRGSTRSVFYLNQVVF